MTTAAQLKAKVTKRKEPLHQEASLSDLPELKLPDSPVSHLLLSNMAPSDSEIILTHRAIQEAEVALWNFFQHAEEKIAAEHSRPLKETEIQQHHIEEAARFIHQHNSLLSPIRRLPIEILQEIIIWATVGQLIKRVDELRWELSQVCRSWRATTLSISMLWKSLPVIELTTSQERTRRQIESLNELLRRSGQAPIVVYINSSQSPTFEISTHPVLDLLVRHSERWKMLNVSLAPVALSGLRAVKGRLPLLEVLGIHIRSRGRLASESLDMFEVAPQLRRIHTSGTLRQDLRLPYSQLVHYKHLWITPFQLTHVVACSALESLMISELSNYIVFPDVTIPRLKKLEVIFKHIPDVVAPTLNCFDHLKLPDIEELTVAVSVSYPSLLPTLTSMISNSRTPCRLKILRIRAELMEPGELTTLLGLTPALVSLDTTMPPPIDINNLVSREGRNPPVPMLETCKFHLGSVVGRFLSSDTHSALNELAASRCELGSNVTNTDVLLPHECRQLKNLCVYSHSEMIEDSPWSHFKQGQLENWAPNPISIQLNKLRSQLHAELPELISRTPKRAGLFPKKWTEKMGKIFDAIESIHIENPRHIYVSRIHLSLKILSEMQYDRDSEKDGFCQRAKAILRTWEPLFLEDLSVIHWSFQGPYSTGYVPSHDGTLTSCGVGCVTDSSCRYQNISRCSAGCLWARK
ncbi:hypothetical protein BDZ97DRAFT_766895 [Flammula alnicola]|nr:hypothetical protein BDZ97DRAFT_766895 [Flammula alnicola]